MYPLALMVEQKDGLLTQDGQIISWNLHVMKSETLPVFWSFWDKIV